MASDAVLYAWNQQSVWSQAANRLKRTISRRRGVVLALTLTGGLLSAVAATAGLSSPAGKVTAFASAVAIGLAGLIRTTIGQDLVRDWTRVRSVSESLKAEVYLHLSGFGREDFDAEIGRLEKTGGDLRRHCAGLHPVTRDLPPVTDFASFLTNRVRRQADDYYHRNANRLRQRLGYTRWTEYGLAAIGVVLAAAAGTWEWDSVAVWVPVVTTAAATVATHAAAQRWSYSQVEYERTAAELDALLARRGAAAHLDDRELAQRAEEIISIENQAWMAKLAEPTES